MFYINNNVDDTGDNTLDTISFLGLQSIVECVDRLDGHCLHNPHRKSHLKNLARCVHGLWLSSTTTRNRTTLARDGLQGLAIGHHILPMFDNPRSQRGGFIVRFQRQGITVEDFTHVSLGPHR